MIEKIEKAAFEGGTNSDGVPGDVFAMPPGMTIRYDKPAADLLDFITGYHVYGVAGVAAKAQTDWFLPGTANVRIAIDAGPIGVTIGRRTVDPVPQASLYGPTSTALKAVTHGGILVGFGVSALGWNRLFRRPAGDFRNRIVPLHEMMGREFVGQLVARLSASDRGADVAPVLDDMLRARLGPPHPDEPHVRQLMSLILDDGPDDIFGVAAQMGIPTHALRRLAVRHFGLPPKLLLMRARFLRSFLRMFRSGDVTDYGVIDGSYFDVPHFLRDANKFLGMTPRRFIALETPFLNGSIRARAAVLGAATQALHSIEKS